jgi:hypothetical protein
VKTEVFVLHAANRAFVNGKRRLPVGMARPGTWFFGFLALFITLPSLFLLAWALWDEHQLQRLRAHGVKAVGTVAHLEESSGESTDIYSVTYKYAVNGRGYEATGNVESIDYIGLAEGSRVAIRYDPEDPSVCRLETQIEERKNQRPEELRAELGFLGGMALFGLFWVVVWYVRGLRPLWRLIRQGRTLRGEVVDCNGRSKGDDYQVTLDYRFTDPDGDEVAGRAEAVRDDLEGSVLPAPGMPVLVYFVDRQTYAVL